VRVLMSADTVGGVWTYALDLARELCARGDEVLLATLGLADRGEPRAAAAIDGLTLICGDYPLEWTPEPWAELERAGEWLLELANDFAPDVVHLNHYCHGHLPWPAPRLVVAHSCVSSWYEAVRGMPPEPQWRRYRREVARGLHGADWVVAPSEAMRHAVVRNYGIQRPRRRPLRARCQAAADSRCRSAVGRG